MLFKQRRKEVFYNRYRIVLFTINFDNDTFRLGKIIKKSIRCLIRVFPPSKSFARIGSNDLDLPKYALLFQHQNFVPSQHLQHV